MLAADRGETGGADGFGTVARLEQEGPAGRDVRQGGAQPAHVGGRGEGGGQGQLVLDVGGLGGVGPRGLLVGRQVAPLGRGERQPGGHRYGRQVIGEGHCSSLPSVWRQGGH
ncbi:hypothetical protein GCM10020254_01750 [Streptomyces goshikiensis]